MSLLKRNILQGWPETRSNCAQPILEFFNHRDELSVEDGLIFQGHTLVIPRSMRSELIQRLCCELKTPCPGLGCNKVPTCLTHRDANASMPLITTEFPDRPYQKIAADLFHFDGSEYLLTKDYYSRFFEVDYLPDTRSQTVIRKLQQHMSRMLIPDIVVSDNAAQFSSADFRDFANEWGFEHLTLSPGYPQSNGLAEKRREDSQEADAKS